jgi:hypothetical protein
VRMEFFERSMAWPHRRWPHERYSTGGSADRASLARPRPHPGIGWRAGHAGGIRRLRMPPIAEYPVLKDIQAQMDDGLRCVFRNFPITSSHPHAEKAAEAAEAAATQGHSSPSAWALGVEMFSLKRFDQDLATTCTLRGFVKTS